MEKKYKPSEAIERARSCYDRVEPLSRGYFRVWQGTKCGIYHGPTGFHIIQPEWDKIKFNHGFFYVWRDGKCGVYNSKGFRIFYPVWDRIQYTKHLFFAWGNGNCRVYSKNGVFIVERKWNKVEYVKPYFRVWKSNKCGIINSDFPALFELKVEWDEVRIMKNGHFLVRRGYKYGVRSEYDTIVLRTEWDSITPVYWKHGSCCYIVQKNNMCGIRSSDGTTILKTEADRIEVRDGYFAVQKNRTWVHFNPFESVYYGLFYFGLSFEDIKALDIRLK